MPKKVKRNRDWMKKRSEESVMRRRASSGSLFDTFYVSGFPMFQPKPGSEYCIRICPPSWTDPVPNHWGIDVYFHSNIGPDNGSFLCFQSMEKYIRKTWNMSVEEFAAKFKIELPQNSKCPIDEDRFNALSNNDTETANALRINRKVLVWLIDRDDEKVGPKLWAMPSIQVDQEILTLIGKPGSIIYPDDPEEGYDITFRCVKQERFYNYKSIAVARDPSPLFEDDASFDAALDFLEKNPLPKMLNWADGDYVNKIHMGGSPKEEKPVTVEKEKESIDVSSLTLSDVNSLDIDDLIYVAEELGFRRAQVMKASEETLRSDIIDELDLGEKEDEIPFDGDDADTSAEEAAKSKAEEYREKFNRKRR